MMDYNTTHQVPIRIREEVDTILQKYKYRENNEQTLLDVEDAIREHLLHNNDGFTNFTVQCDRNNNVDPRENWRRMHKFFNVTVQVEEYNAPMGWNDKPVKTIVDCGFYIGEVRDGMDFDQAMKGV